MRSWKLELQEANEFYEIWNWTQSVENFIFLPPPTKKIEKRAIWRLGNPVFSTKPWFQRIRVTRRWWRPVLACAMDMPVFLARVCVLEMKIAGNYGIGMYICWNHPTSHILETCGFRSDALLRKLEEKTKMGNEMKNCKVRGARSFFLL